MHLSELCDLPVLCLHGCSIEAHLRFELEKAWVMSWVMHIIHHCPVNQGGCSSPISSQHAHQKTHDQQCCTKRNICCCGDVCHQRKQFLTSLQEHALTPGWYWSTHHAQMAGWVDITCTLQHKKCVNSIWSIPAQILPEDLVVWRRSGEKLCGQAKTE